MDVRPIGVFDSGVGGLTVVKEINRLLPQEKIIYFGDTARVPYGSKSKSTIIRYSRQIIKFLLSKDVKAIVIACNTASAYALEAVKEAYDFPIMGVHLSGTAQVAVQITKNKKIGVIGTEGLIRSDIYKHFINDIDDEITVIGKACPLFVPLVEEGLIEDSVTNEIANRYLKQLIDDDIDTLILGCTHYPMLKNTIHKIMGEKVYLVDPAYETAKTLKKVLEEQHLINNDLKPKHEFYVSDMAEKYENFAKDILHRPMMPVKEINIEEY